MMGSRGALTARRPVLSRRAEARGPERPKRKGRRGNGCPSLVPTSEQRSPGTATELIPMNELVVARRRRGLLFSIRAVHSAVFLTMLSAIGWLLATGLAGRRDRSVVVAGSLVAAESVVFLANDGVCPLTPLAERFGAERGGVSDMFLPRSVAETIPIWATSLVVLGVALLVRGLLVAGRRRRAVAWREG